MIKLQNKSLVWM